MPNTLRPRYRWIVRKREDGRIMVRTPKIGVMIRDLMKFRDEDYNKEVLLPKDAKPFVSTSGTRKSKKGMSKKTKSRRR